MERRSITAIAAALAEAHVRYLVVGGVAVVAHGVARFTADLDVVLDPDPASVTRAIEAFSRLGYGPRAPVDFASFADPACRSRWAQEKNLTVFSIFSPAHKATEVDLFLESPFDFDAAHARAWQGEAAPGVPLWFVAKVDLIALKRQAGRPQDLLDIGQLEATPDIREAPDAGA